MVRMVPHNGGWLEVVCGPMFSGKSQELMRRITRAEIAKQRILLLKPSIDNRYDDNNIVSHTGQSLKAIAVQEEADILVMAKSLLPDVIGIDEVQFFNPLIVSIINDLVELGIRVIVSGLDQDFRGEPFAVTIELLGRAEFIDKYQAICMKCGGEASRTQRLVNGDPARWNDDQIVIGASEQYEARCRSCHQIHM